MHKVKLNSTCSLNQNYTVNPEPRAKYKCLLLYAIKMYKVVCYAVKADESNNLSKYIMQRGKKMAQMIEAVFIPLETKSKL